jgi:hypothetical protein
LISIFLLLKKAGAKSTAMCYAGIIYFSNDLFIHEKTWGEISTAENGTPVAH